MVQRKRFEDIYENTFYRICPFHEQSTINVAILQQRTIGIPVDAILAEKN